MISISSISSSPRPDTGEVRFWETRRFAIMLVLLTALPLLWPAIPPLVDLPGHMGRYRVQLDLAESEALQRFYTFEWRLIGNLGLDLLVIPMEKLFGLELAVKLVVLAIPPLTAAGLLLIARVVHGRLPPTAALALPMAYSFPFHFGFANFSLAIALGLLAFALWRWLAIKGRFKLRAAIFLPLSIMLWVVHTFGWGVLGVLAYAAEMVRRRDSGQSWFKAWLRAPFDCLPLVLPMLLMILWRTGQVGGRTGDWFNWHHKFRWFYMMLRDRWEVFDIACVALLSAVLLSAFLIMVWDLIRRPPERHRVDFSRMLAMFAVFLTLVFLFLPRIVFGSAYADMRLAPLAFAMGLLAIRFKPGTSVRALRWIAIASLAFFLEVGCGTGHNVLMLKRFGEVDAIEIDEAARAVASERLGKLVGSAPLPELTGVEDRAYDMIAILDVLEHVEADREALVSMARKLKPGGRILITVPAHPWMWSAHDVVNHHQRRYTKKSLSRVIAAAGLKADLISYFNSLLFPLAAAARLAGRVTGKEDSDDKLPPGPLNRIFETLFDLERHALGRMPFPPGVSLVAIVSAT